jgi:hypothetical protein
MTKIDWQALAHPGPASDYLAPRAKVLMGGSAFKDRYDGFAASYDRWDYVHFRDRGLGRSSDVWDNRRKVVA